MTAPRVGKKRWTETIKETLEEVDFATKNLLKAQTTPRTKQNDYLAIVHGHHLAITAQLRELLSISTGLGESERTIKIDFAVENYSVDELREALHAKENNGTGTGLRKREYEG